VPPVAGWRDTAPAVLELLALAAARPTGRRRDDRDRPPRSPRPCSTRCSNAAEGRWRHHYPKHLPTRREAPLPPPEERASDLRWAHQLRHFATLPPEQRPDLSLTGVDALLDLCLG
jgi:hypothetical protein